VAFRSLLWIYGFIIDISADFYEPNGAGGLFYALTLGYSSSSSSPSNILTFLGAFFFSSTAGFFYAIPGLPLDNKAASEFLKSSFSPAGFSDSAFIFSNFFYFIFSVFSFSNRSFSAF
jgi:hypothetical protein